MNKFIPPALTLLLVFIPAFAVAAPVFTSQADEINSLNSLSGSPALLKSTGSGEVQKDNEQDESNIELPPLAWLGIAVGVTLVCILAVELGKIK